MSPRGSPQIGDTPTTFLPCPHGTQMSNSPSKESRTVPQPYPPAGKQSRARSAAPHPRSPHTHGRRNPNAPACTTRPHALLHRPCHRPHPPHCAAPSFSFSFSATTAAATVAAAAAAAVVPSPAPAAARLALTACCREAR